MTNEPRVLIVEDVPSLAQTYKVYLRPLGARVETVDRGAVALDYITKHTPHVVILDVNLPDMTGIDILQTLRERGCPSQVIVVTSDGSISLAVDAMREGAFDFVVKPFNAERLRVTTRNALERSRLSETLREVKDTLGRDSFFGFLGESLKMQSAYRIIQSAATSKATVFITGESGTGKEVCASALHKASPRADKPFIAINCAAIPQNLLESELFGHIKGAFTGATSDRLGAILSADRGTLFLDEIGEMDIDFQAKLLRFIETGSVRRLGEDRSRACDVRIVCATNRDPFKAVAEGRFREDLLYRLHVIPIEMPPLREREGDILILAKSFLREFGQEDNKTFDGFAPDAEECLLKYRWPGNVRQLRNVIQKLVVMHDGGLIRSSQLPAELQQAGQGSHGPSSFCETSLSPGSHRRTTSPPAPAPASYTVAPLNGNQIAPLEQQIDQAIDVAIRAYDGSIPKAAAALKVSPSTIYRRLNNRVGRATP